MYPLIKYLYNSFLKRCLRYLFLKYLVTNVKDFVHLGAMITENYDDSIEIKRRIAIAQKMQ